MSLQLQEWRAGPRAWYPGEDVCSGPRRVPLQPHGRGAGPRYGTASQYRHRHLGVAVQLSVHGRSPKKKSELQEYLGRHCTHPFSGLLDALVEEAYKRWEPVKSSAAANEMVRRAEPLAFEAFPEAAPLLPAALQ